MWAGSSPLARGLRVGDDIGVGAVGIIPARAGFTKMIIIGTHRIGDHPRSRGVYRTTTRRSPTGSGSSPLARGLLVHAGAAPAEEGIIPARAGFTGVQARRGRGPEDHPRSRGVYKHTAHSEDHVVGSSPLARGLHTYYPAYTTSHGIIPARAGFTATTTPPGATPTDHPRSRGVYVTRTSTKSTRRGSSPLARGLLSWPRRWRRWPRDHPHSRGVYTGRPRGCGPRPGSSPLARGLLCERPAQPIRTRIILARAGFTILRRLPRRRPRDHPRSRGVYLWTTRPARAPSGSSPLARGLHRLDAVPHGETRIIPARAGFTSRRGR